MSNSQIQQVKEATDVVQIIGERLSLQRSGSTFKANCPFHSEKSPSFFVNEQMQRYKCFGCGESGDVLTFLEKYDGMTFAEALKYLAERAGITLEQFTPTKEDTKREDILGVLDLAKEYYHYLLTKHEVGKPAREYLAQRGVTAESIKLFQLGYAIPSWDGLVKFLHTKKHYELSLLEEAGMVVTGKTGRAYDRFRGRLMFPLRNHRGQIVGFSGRLLEKDAKEAKYLNTPETSLYHKGKMLFGYAELYQEIRKKKEVVVVEGEFDVVSSTQAHVNHVVAIKGSALTTDHLKLLQRAASKVLFALDTDSAGVEATKRALALAQQTELELRVIVVPGGKDPDELASKDPAAWREATKKSISVYDYLLQASLATHDPNSPEGKRHIMTELAPVLNSIPLEVEREVYLKKLAEALQVRLDLVKADVAKLGSIPGKLASQLNLKRPARASDATTETAGAQNKPTKPKLTKQAKIENYGLFLALQSGDQPLHQRLSTLMETIAESAAISPLIKALQELPETRNTDQFWQAVAQHLPTDHQEFLSEVMINPEFTDSLPDLDLEKEWKKTLGELHKLTVQVKVGELAKELDKLDAKATKTPEEEARQNQLLAEIVGWQRTLKSVN